MRAGRSMAVMLWLAAAACQDGVERKAAPASTPAPAPEEQKPATTTPDAAPIEKSLDDQIKSISDAERDEMLGRPRENLTATPATCDPAADPTRAWAYQAYLRAGGEEHGHPFVRFRKTGHIAGLWELMLEGGPDQPAEHFLAYAWRCRVYKDEAALAKLILLDQSWKEADAARRIELAGAIDRWMYDVITRQPDDWDAKQTFTAPEAKETASGAVELTRWIYERRVISYSTGKSEVSYKLQKVTFSAAGAPSRPKTLKTVKVAPNTRSPNPFR